MPNVLFSISVERTKTFYTKNIIVCYMGTKHGENILKLDVTIT